MITVGRLTGVIGTLGGLVLFALLGAGVEGSVNAPGAMDVVGAIVALSMFLSWFIAIWHWGRYYPAEGQGKGTWGVVVIMGFFLGATAYWFLKAHRSIPT